MDYIVWNICTQLVGYSTPTTISITHHKVSQDTEHNDSSISAPKLSRCQIFLLKCPSVTQTELLILLQSDNKLCSNAEFSSEHITVTLLIRRLPYWSCLVVFC